ncbi:MAG: fused MFS/spermidine synthase [Gammaproteobacteria bacterium]
MAFAVGRSAYFALFALSGFTGLIYESIWSHYLKLFLGHAAYAQTLVLAIFMGGLAFGSWLAAGRSHRWRNLLLGYAIVEGIIGVLGIAFHSLFTAATSFSFDFAIPAIGSGFGVDFYKWSLAALMILPQSVLLGMTFPLMSGGIIRKFPGTPGHTLAFLYFTNSIGAAVGVLISGFVLIRLVGLPGTILAAGIVNILLAIVVYGLAKSHAAVPAHQPSQESEQQHYAWLLLLAAFVTGAASFIYEIGWIRMLSMVLGSSTHSFELMLSAFITGLAFGSLWIRKRIDMIGEPTRFAGWVQILMGLAALATIPLYNYTFDIMGMLLRGLAKTDAGYGLYILSSHFLVLLVMLPTTFLAGMTLPLFTAMLLARGYGERSIGHIYAANTVGAIVGVFFAVHVGMPLLGLKGMISVGSGMDILLGLLLLSVAYSGSRRLKLAFPAALGIASISMVLVATEFDVRRMASGVFRFGLTSLGNEANVLFHKDGKTSSISLVELGDFRMISTNGKPDAQINMTDGDAGADAITMSLAAALPLAIAPETKSVANIGMGSGLTTHVLLTWPGIQSVDTIEIEPAIVEAAESFRPKVELAYADSRSHIHIEDAKTYFAKRGQQYDLIVSEPSNPWVSGVASLFSEEFYEHITRYLNRDGLLVQWIQLYEIDIALVFSILKALDKHFENFDIYHADDGNLLIVAKVEGEIPPPGASIFDNPATEQELRELDVTNLNDLRTRWLGDETLFTGLMQSSSSPPNSDFFPFVDLQASKSRYMQHSAGELTSLRRAVVPVLEIMKPEMRLSGPTQIGGSFSRYSKSAAAAKSFHAAVIERNRAIALPGNSLLSSFEVLQAFAEQCQSNQHAELWLNLSRGLASDMVPYLSAEQLADIWPLITPSCDHGLTEIQSKWLELYKALGQRDAEGLDAITLQLADYEPDKWDSSLFRLFVSARLAGLVGTGKAEQAVEFWNTSAPRLGNAAPPLHVRLLLTKALHDVNGGAAAQ